MTRPDVIYLLLACSSLITPSLTLLHPHQPPRRSSEPLHAIPSALTALLPSCRGLAPLLPSEFCPNVILLRGLPSLPTCCSYSWDCSSALFFFTALMPHAQCVCICSLSPTTRIWAPWGQDFIELKIISQTLEQWLVDGKTSGTIK